MRLGNIKKASAVLMAAALSFGGTAGVFADTLPTVGVANFTSSGEVAALPTVGFASEAIGIASDTEENLVAVIAENERIIVAAQYANIAIATVNDYVYVRSEPNTESEYVGKLYANNEATVLETLDGWYKIQSGSVVGYVASEFLAVGDEELAKSAGTRVAIVNTETLYVRSEASTEGSVVAYAADGQALKVTDESGDAWIAVKAEDEDGNTVDGFVAKEFVSLETKYTYAESKAEEEARLAAEEAERQRKAEEEARKKAAESAAKSKKSSGSSSSEGSKSYNPPSGGNGAAVAEYALQFTGNPYVWGGTSLTNGADCSGFVLAVYKQFGVSLPHSSSADRSVGYGVGGVDEAQPGDIICYSGHVGIYVGNGQICHASNHRTGIIVSDVNYNNVLAVRRIF